MQKQLFSIALFLFLLSCSRNEKDFDSFEYSFGGFRSTKFSIKFTESDTLFLREHWNVVERHGITYPKDKTNYIAILSQEQRNQLSELLKKINFKNLKSEYYEAYNDGSAYQIIFKKDNLSKTVFVHSHNTPKELDSLSNWIWKTKMNLKLIKTNREFVFKSIDAIFPTPPPPPPLKK
jgi:ribosomal protein S15P/S13E